MANITLSNITPQNLYETVKLLKSTEHRIYITVDSLEIRFTYDRNESKEETDKRFNQLEHFMMFIQELVHSDVPIDLEEFIRKYRKIPRASFFRSKF